jgi:hypothetical protein
MFTEENKEIYEEYEMIEAKGKDPINVLNGELTKDFRLMDVEISRWLERVFEGESSAFALKAIMDI